MNFDEDSEGDKPIAHGSMAMTIRLTGLSPDSPDTDKYDVAESRHYASTNNNETPEHLLLAIFTEKGELVDTILEQDKVTAKEFGTFNKELLYGKYTILALGWRGDQKCIIGNGTDRPNSLDSISFSEHWVPNCYVCRQNIVVSDSYSDTRTLSLKRCVTKFRVMFEDNTKPQNLDRILIEANGIGWRMDPVTLFCEQDASCARNISVNNTIGGVACYAFLPHEEVETDITVTAYDTKGNIINARTFPSVPLKVNRCTEYTGRFFANDVPLTMDIDYDWEEDNQVKF